MHDAAEQVGWAEVEHWMWPLFSEGWRRWRAETLGLPPVPLSGVPLPRPPPLLYGLPEALIARPGYWPASVQLCGFWLDGQVTWHVHCPPVRIS